MLIRRLWPHARHALSANGARRICPRLLAITRYSKTHKYSRWVTNYLPASNRCVSAIINSFPIVWIGNNRIVRIPDLCFMLSIICNYELSSGIMRNHFSHAIQMWRFNVSVSDDLFDWNARLEDTTSLFVIAEIMHDCRI